MAFPTIPTGARILSSRTDTAGTTHTFPSLSDLTKNAGDLLIAIIGTYDGNSANAEFSGWGGGFNECGDFATTTTASIGVAYKFSTGSETGTFTVTSSGSAEAGMILMSIPGAHASTPPETGGYLTGTNAVANAGSLDPGAWATEDTLWITACVIGENSISGTWGGVNSAPTGWSGYAETGPSGDEVGAIEVGVAFLQSAVASVDPPAFGSDASNTRFGAITIAVRPAAPVPQTVNITAATAAWTARNLVHGGHYLHQMVPAVAAWSARALSPAGAAVTANLTAAASAWSARALAASQATFLVAATATWSARALSPAGAPITVNLNAGGAVDYAALVLADNPEAYWRLDEESDVGFTDLSGHGHTGDTAGWLVGGGALGFTGLLVGDSDLCAGIDGNAFYLGTAFKNEVGGTPWAYLQDDADSMSWEFWCELLGNETWDNANFTLGFGTLTIMVTGIDVDALFVGESTNYMRALWAALPPNRVHVLITYDGSVPVARSYVNGVERAFDDTPDGTLDVSTDAGIALSATGFGGNETGWRFDEFAIYHSALSAEQALAHYNAGNGEGTGPPGLYAHWSARALVPTSAPATVTLTPATASWSSAALAPAGAAATVNLTPATASWSARALDPSTVSAQPQTIDLTAATASWSATALAPAGAATTVSIAASTAAWSAQALAPAGAPITVLLGGGTYASDSFNRANANLDGQTADNAAGGVLTAKWSTKTGTFEVVTNAAEVTNSGGTEPVVVLATGAAADMRVSAKQLTDNSGPIARWTPTGGNPYGQFYLAFWDDAITTSKLRLYKRVGAGWVAIGSDSVASVVAGDVIAVECVGNQIRGYINGALACGPVTDNAYASGQPGWYGGGGATQQRADDFVYGLGVSIPTATWSASPLTVQAPATTPLVPATAQWTAQALTPSSGAGTATVTAGAATWTAGALLPSAGTPAQQVSLQAAQASWSARALAPAGVAATASLTAAVASWSAQTLTATGGAVTRNLTAAVASWSARVLTTSRVILITPATAAWSARVLVGTSGAVTASISAASATWLAVALVPTGAPVSISIVAAHASWSGEALAPSTPSQPQTVVVSFALATWSAEPVAAIAGLVIRLIAGTRRSGSLDADVRETTASTGAVPSGHAITDARTSSTIPGTRRAGTLLTDQRST